MANQVTNYKCPACTGPLRFDSATGKLTCDYCGTSYEVSEIEALFAEKEQKAAEAKKTPTKKPRSRKSRRRPRAGTPPILAATGGKTLPA